MPEESGAGGIGIRFVWPDETVEEKAIDFSPAGYREATIGEMDLQACIVAFEEAEGPQCPFRVHKINKYSDAIFVVNAIGQAQTFWQRNGWYTRDGTPVANVLLWKKLTEEIGRARTNGIRGDIKWPESEAIGSMSWRRTDWPRGQPGIRTTLIFP